ncbi:hypothetical protein TI39_contig4111g00023 [Zymoseptoria brevis]|uniref:Uncharacterized protein n=1 Tax=Zymoseptoria brevis TaxID=1047168 RepID=A0A0F4GDH7_9PEZI|nr:hypothetical protein TI39_contig4111g00023 [Zymoseptoria brevis]
MAAIPTLSTRWQTAPNEVVDMVIAEIVLTPLQVIALPGHPTHSNRKICAAHPEDWETLKSVLRLDFGTRRSALLTLKKHGALQDVQLKSATTAYHQSLRSPHHGLLRHFRWIYKNHALPIQLGPLNEVKSVALFVKVPGPPQLNHIARIEVASEINPCFEASLAEQELIENQHSQDTETRLKREDSRMAEIALKLCRAAAWSSLFETEDGRHLYYRMESSKEIRRLIVWEEYKHEGV